MKLYSADSSAFQPDRDDGDAQYFDLYSVAGIIGRQWKLFAVIMVTSLCLCVLYLATAVPFYSSEIRIVLDQDGDQPNEKRSVADIDWARAEPTRNDPYILTQMQLFRSNTIVDRVIDQLDLLNNQEFMASNRSLFSSGLNIGANILALFGIVPDGGKVVGAEKLRDAARYGLLSGMGVTRLGESSVLRISYLSTSPAMSARIVNAIGDAYSTDLLNARYDATRLAGSWLQERIGELRQKALESDLAVQKFRTDRNLFMTGETETTESVLISKRQLEELNTALTSARADAAQARAQYEQIKRIIDTKQIDAQVSGTIRNYLSNSLRQRYLEVVRLEADIARRFGENHEQVVRLKAEIVEYQKLMFEELQRVAESYLSEMKVAESRVESIAQSTKKSTTVSNIAAEDQVQMRELERAAETYRRLYEAFLKSYQSSIQQQTVPVTMARVVSSGRPADTASQPRPSLFFGLFFMIGMVTGGALAAFRESRDRFFRTGEEIRSWLGLEFLGNAPLVGAAGTPPASSRPGKAQPGDPPNAVIDGYSVDRPFSTFAETLRSAKIALDLGTVAGRARKVGIVSTLPGEGKSTIAVNFARLLAHQGKRVVLIDADLRNPGATRMLAPDAKLGILDVLLQRADVNDVLIADERNGLRFLPAVNRHRVPQSADLLSSDAMGRIIDALSKETDYIVFDLPPVGPVVDARAMSGFIDGFLYVVEWGTTSRNAISRILSSEPQVLEKCVGAILSKVDERRVKRYMQADDRNGGRL